MSISSTQLVDKFVGNSEKAVEQMFERARMVSPCILYIADTLPQATLPQTRYRSTVKHHHHHHHQQHHYHHYHSSSSLFIMAF